MTIAISLKVNDGLVLAADSASTLIGRAPTGETAVVNVYNSANKVFNLRKGLPIGAITWGSGSIGTASISTLAKDLRRRFSGEDGDHPNWHLDASNYRVEDVAAHLREFFFDEHYVEAFADWPEKPRLGFLVAGYSSNCSMAEEFLVDINNGVCDAPMSVRGLTECGLTWNGEPEAITRIVLGYGVRLPDILREHLGVPEDQVGPALQIIREHVQAQFVQPAMPFQDAIDLAEFLVGLTIQYSRFNVGAPTVGGPIEIAAISKHEGFKWVKRKHYYGGDLNPEGAST